jgi:CelD/BcsL family acetyltransferase involved in cellulose biosynthesis
MADAHYDLAGRSTHGMPQAIPAATPLLRVVPPATRLSVVSDPAQFAALESSWRQLEASSPDRSNVFQSFDWLSNWAHVYGGSSATAGLHVVLGHRGSRLVFAWPLMRTKAGPLTILRWMSEPVSQYGDILLDTSEDAETWMADALTELRQTPGIDALRLRHVRADAAAAPFLQRYFRDSRMPEQAPWLDLSVFADEAAYDARYNAVQRKRRKKYRKSLEDAVGPVVFEILRPGLATDQAIEHAVSLKSEWIEQRGRHNQVLNCEEVKAFFKRLARRQSDTVQLVVSALTAGGKPVSWEIGLRQRGVHYAFLTSHVIDMEEFSPARLHMDLAQRLAIKNGIKSYDLMVPSDAYKESWSSHRCATADYHLPLSARGWVFGVIYLEQLRPVLRKAYYRMPERVLRLLKPILGH